MRQHLPKLLELVGERHVLHLDRDLLRWRQPVEHLPERAGQGVEAHLHACLRDHIGLEQAGEGEPSTRVAPHQGLGEFLEALVLFEPPLDRLLPGLQILLLPHRRVRHQAGGLELDQPRPDHQERCQLVQRWRLSLDGLKVVIGQAGERDRLEIDLRSLREGEQQLDRPVEGGRADDVDGIALELGRDLRTQFRASARFS